MYSDFDPVYSQLGDKPSLKRWRWIVLTRRIIADYSHTLTRATSDANHEHINAGIIRLALSELIYRRIANLMTIS